MHIATVSTKNMPNLAVVSDMFVLDEIRILISNNEMINTPDNIIQNGKIGLTSFNDKWAEIRMTCTAQYFKCGEWLELANQLFNNETATPKGAVVVEVKKSKGLRSFLIYFDY